MRGFSVGERVFFCRPHGSLLARSGGLLLLLLPPNERAKRPASAGSPYGPYRLRVAPPIVSGTHVTDTLRGSGPDKSLIRLGAKVRAVC